MNVVCTCTVRVYFVYTYMGTCETHNKPQVRTLNIVYIHTYVIVHKLVYMYMNISAHLGIILYCVCVWGV